MLRQGCSSLDTLIAVVMPVFSKLFINADLTPYLLDQCLPSVLYTLRHLSHFHLVVVDVYLAQAFDVNSLICCFFPDVIQFCNMQVTTHVVISGSLALQFFDRTNYPGSDMDVLCDFWFGAELCAFVVEEGYTFLPCSGYGESFADELVVDVWEDALFFPTIPGVGMVLNFRKHLGGRER